MIFRPRVKQTYLKMNRWDNESQSKCEVIDQTDESYFVDFTLKDGEKEEGEKDG